MFIPALLVLLAIPTPTSVSAAGTTIAVTTTSDELATDGNCSLREAITAANTDLAVDACPAGHGDDTITVPAGTYGLSIAGASEDANQTGDLDLTSDLSIVGAGSASTIIDARGIDRVVDIPTAASVRLAGVTLTGGSPDAAELSSGDFGGIHNEAGTVILDRVVVAGNGTANLGSSGAGIVNIGTMTISRSAVTGNVAFGAVGGGILNRGTLAIEDSTISGNSNRVGGGIANEGVLRVERSTIASNAANQAGDYSSPSGGGLYNAGTATVINTTVTGNGASANSRAHADGAGISNDGALTLTDSTIADNHNDARCEDFCAAGHNAGIAGPATVGGTIVSGNTATFDNVTDDIPPATVPADCATITSFGGNVIGSTSDCVIGGATGADLLDVDPLLAPLADNGGPTLTRALGAGSPAIDVVPTGSNGCGTTITTDQRGVGRPQGSGCDSGAYEVVEYSFSGFFGPVKNLPAVNAVVAGVAVPIVFSLGANEGLDIFAPGSPQSRAISCETKAPTGPFEPTATAGASGLSYDPTTGRYTYVWKTEKAWATTCRQLLVTLSDGSLHQAVFTFR